MRVFAPALLAAAMILSSGASAQAFGLFGCNFGGHNDCCGAPACEPVCGSEPIVVADPCCPPRPSLCDKIKGFFHKKSNACCAPPVCEPACGMEPACGCEPICEPACGFEPACGCDAHCAPKPCLLDKLFGKLRMPKLGCAAPACCDAPVCEPACGAEPTCGCGF